MGAAVLIPLIISGASFGAQMAVQYISARKNNKPQKVDRGRNDDARVMTSELGGYIVRGWGRFRVAPNILWHTGVTQSTNVTRQTQRGGSKKAPSQVTETTTYTYKTSLGLLACHGVINNIDKIWGDSDLLYNLTPDPNMQYFEAEDGVLSGGAVATADVACSSGFKVTGIGSGGVLEIIAEAPSVPLDPTDSERTLLTIYYKSSADKTLYVSYDNDTPVAYTLPSSGGDVITYSITVDDHPTSFEFSNSGAATVDIDRVTVYYSYVDTFLGLPEDLPITGIRDEFIAFPRNRDLPQPFYNYQPQEDVGTGQFAFSIPRASGVRIYRGTETQEPDPALIAYLDTRYGAGNGEEYASAYRGLAMAVLEDYQLPEGRLQNFTLEVNEGTTSLSAIITDLHAEKGIGSGDLDLTALAGKTRQGLITTQMTSPAAIINQLEDWYRFRMVEMDGKIKACLNNSEVVATITSDDLRAVDYGSEFDDHDSEISEISPNDLPQTVYVNHLDKTTVGLDFHNNAQQATLDGSTDPNDIWNLSFPFIATPAETKGVAERTLIEAHLGKFSHSFKALPEYAKYTPMDTIELALANATHKVRLEKKQMGLPAGAVHFEAKSVDEVNIVANITETATITDRLPDTVRFPANTELVIFESEPVELSQEGFGVIAAVSSRGAGRWQGAQLYAKNNTSGEEFKLYETFTTSTPIGVAQAVLANHAPSTEDTTNSLLVYFYEDVTLETITSGERAANPLANLIRLGSEWLQFRTAVAASLSAGSSYKSAYTISNLTRGLFSTSAAKSTHGAGETAMVYTAAVKFVKFDSVYLNESVAFTAPTVGQSTEVSEQTILTLSGKAYNTEISKPTIAQQGSSSEDDVQITVANYTNAMRYRQIQVAEVSNFSAVLEDDVKDYRNIAHTTTGVETVEKPVALVGDTAYIRVRHSSTGIDYSPWSDALEVEFVNELDLGVPVLADDAIVELIGETALFRIPYPQINAFGLLELQIRFLSLASDTTADGAQTAGTTTIVLDNASGFNSAGGRAFNDRTKETYWYTGVSGNSLTGVTRGQENSAAAAILDGDEIFDIVAWEYRLLQPTFTYPRLTVDSLLHYRWRNEYGLSEWRYGANVTGTTTTPAPPPFTPDPPPAGRDRAAAGL